jgi:hypothetical protein
LASIRALRHCKKYFENASNSDFIVIMAQDLHPTPDNLPLLFNLQIDCETTQNAIQNSALGERAILGLGDILENTGTKGSFLVIPGDLEAHANIYKELEKAGHEIGLHYHPWEEGRSEFLGSESPEVQREVLSEGIDRFEQVMQRRPLAFCPGYGSANDFTAGILEELGFRHGLLSIPTRDLPQCACVWGSSPLDPHYPHRYNKSMVGNVDFVDIPPTIDPASRMWGGAHPQDLRVELVDAKNHYYTVQKSIRRQIDANTPLIQIHALTHNIFEYSDLKNFRRETYVGIVDAVREISRQENRTFQAVTLAEIAIAYRQAVPLDTTQVPKLTLDTRGRAFTKS